MLSQKLLGSILILIFGVSENLVISEYVYDVLIFIFRNIAKVNWADFLGYILVSFIAQ